jgi:histidyl-tRNA synthetase
METMVTGMRDFLPNEKQRREKALTLIRSVYVKYGFSEIETPVMENIETLRGSSGGDNTKMTFEVLKRRIKPDTLKNAQSPQELVDLGLRYDLTVPLSRFYGENKASLPSVFKSIQIAPVWRAERPQKGRYRQFMQCDIDIIGESTSIAEIELVTVTANALAALGLDEITVRMNDRKLLDRFLENNGIPDTQKNQVLVILDKRDKLSEEKILEEFSKIDILPDRASQLLDFYALEENDDLSNIITSVNAILGKEVAVFDPSLVRGMGYYTGTIYEVQSAQESYSLGGGGRYDNMIGTISGTPTPAVGFSLGFERIVDLITSNLADKKESVALVYTPSTDTQVTVAYMKALNTLITQGYTARLVKKAKNTRLLLDRLQSEGFTSFAFIDEGNTEVNLRSFS